MKKIIFALMFILLITSVSAIGLCELDKEVYHRGEDAIYSCSCTSAAEENRVGFIIWKNETNSTLQTTAISSGSCRTIPFVDSHIFDPTANYSGNVSFYGDILGTTDPSNWDYDITLDTFNVTDTHVSDCLITFENTTGEPFNLGELAALQINVVDGVDNDPLISAKCHLHVLDITGQSIMQEPYSPEGVSFLPTGADGEVLFQHEMVEPFWIPGGTYVLEANCYCTPNQTTEQCYKVGSGAGEVAGMKTCTAQEVFTTGLIDYRSRKNISEVLIYIFVILFFLVLIFGYHHMASSKDLEKWNNKLYEECKNRNYVKVALGAIGYHLMKAKFIVYYLLGLPIILLITEVTKVFNILSLSTVLQNFLVIYIVGVIIVGIVFLSYIQEWFMDLLKTIQDNDWGIGK